MCHGACHRGRSMRAPAERPILYTGTMVRGILDELKTQTRRVVKPQPPTSESVLAISGSGYGFHHSIREPWRISGPVWAVRDLMDGREPEWKCPYGVPGDLLYVRENARLEFWEDDYWCRYQADGPDVVAEDEGLIWLGDDIDEVTTRWIERAKWRADDSGASVTPWRPGMLVPKSLSRLWLRVTDVRVERVQKISTEDVLAEGVRIPCMPDGSPLLSVARPKGGRAAASFLPKGRLLPGQPPLTDVEYLRIYFAELWDSINAKRGYGWDANPWVWVVEFERVEVPR